MTAEGKWTITGPARLTITELIRYGRFYEPEQPPENDTITGDTPSEHNS